MKIQEMNLFRVLAATLCVSGIGTLSGCNTTSSEKGPEATSSTTATMKEGAAKIGDGITEVAKGAGRALQQATCPVVAVKTTKVYYTKKDQSYSEILKGEKIIGNSENRECFVSREAAASSGYKHVAHKDSQSPRTNSRSAATQKTLPPENTNGVSSNQNTSSPTGDISNPNSTIPTGVTSNSNTSIPTADTSANPDGDNSSQNKTQNGSIGTTADQQNNSKNDLEVARKIRRSITSDSDLSVYAHNVKIISENGMVVLKGPVRTAEEKSNVEKKAAAVAGAEHLRSELEVVPR